MMLLVKTHEDTFEFEDPGEALRLVSKCSPFFVQITHSETPIREIDIERLRVLAGHRPLDDATVSAHLDAVLERLMGVILRECDLRLFEERGKRMIGLSGSMESVGIIRNPFDDTFGAPLARLTLGIDVVGDEDTDPPTLPPRSLEWRLGRAEPDGWVLVRSRCTHVIRVRGLRPSRLIDVILSRARDLFDS